MDGLLGIGAPNAPDGLVRAGNIDITRRPVVKNKDGSVSTIASMSINSDGVEWLIPTIRPDGVRMTPQEAVKHFYTTGQHLGAFVNQDYANKYARALSEYQGATLRQKGLLK